MLWQNTPGPSGSRQHRGRRRFLCHCFPGRVRRASGAGRISVADLHVTIYRIGKCADQQLHLTALLFGIVLVVGILTLFV